jgi:DNA-binding NarL/FixJ family response regulator
VLVVDDDAGARALLEAVLAGGGFEVAAAATGEEALSLARSPVAAVVDVVLPGMSGYEVCRRLRERHGPQLPVVFVSGERTESFDRVAGLMLGGDDYLVKPFAADELVARVRACLRRAPAPGPSPLTRRELEVLRLLAEGLDQAAIARRLVISPKTVGTHIEHILEKLSVHSRAQAVAVAYRDHLLGVPA